MKRDYTKQQLSHFILACFLLIQCGVILLLVSQSFTATIKQLILGGGVTMISVGGVCILSYILFKSFFR